MVEVVQGVINRPSLRDILENIADIPEGLVGGALGDSPWRPTDVVLGISSGVGFPALLVEVAAYIHGRNVKVLINSGSTSNYISDFLVLALRMDVVPEKDFKVLELANNR